MYGVDFVSVGIVEALGVGEGGLGRCLASNDHRQNGLNLFDRQWEYLARLGDPSSCGQGEGDAEPRRFLSPIPPGIFRRVEIVEDIVENLDGSSPIREPVSGNE